jgi:hypothetical protein
MFLEKEDKHFDEGKYILRPIHTDKEGDTGYI